MIALDKAYEELDRIARYFNKNWMDEDFPTDALYEILSRVRAEQQAKVPVGG